MRGEVGDVARRQGVSLSAPRERERVMEGGLREGAQAARRIGAGGPRKRKKGGERKKEKGFLGISLIP